MNLVEIFYIGFYSIACDKKLKNKSFMNHYDNFTSIVFQAFGLRNAVGGMNGALIAFYLA